MGTPVNRAAYRRYYEILDQAIDSKNGVRIECKDRGDAYQYRVRLHAARTLDRELNFALKIDGSEYDNLFISTNCIGAKWYIYIQNAAQGKVEEIPDATNEKEGYPPTGEETPQPKSGPSLYRRRAIAVDRD